MSQRVALGEIGGGNFGLKVSTPGNDVLTGTMEDDKLSFDSSWPAALNVKTILQGSFTPAGGSNVLLQLNVNFGFTLSVIPIVLIMFRPHSGIQWYPNSIGEYNPSNSAYGDITTTSADVVYNNNGGSFDYKIIVMVPV